MIRHCRIRRPICVILFELALIFFVAGLSVAEPVSYSLPVAFEPLRPSKHGAKFWSRTNGLPVYFYPESVTFVRPDSSSQQGPSKTSVLRMSFLNCTLNSVLRPTDRLAGRVNYYTGARASWRTDVPQYSSLKYISLYPAIDLQFHGTPSNLEYDFIVQPEGDFRNIQLDFENADAIKIDASGDLILTKHSKTLRFKKPLIYQGSGSQRVIVDGGFEVSEKKKVEFWVGKHDEGKALIIDPVLDFSTLFGGTVNGIVLDPNGDIIIAGQAGSSLPLVAPYQASVQNYPAAFVTKFNPASGQLIYSTYFSGSQSSNAIGVGVDASGNAYISGNSQSADIPTTNGAFMTQCPGICNTPYIAKFDPNGHLVYSTYTGGSNSAVHGIAVDPTGDAFITGTIASNDLPVVNAFQPNFSGQVSTSTRNAFVQKLDPTGSQLIYSTYLGGGGESGTAIALDSAGSAHVVGSSGGGIPLKNALQTDSGSFFLSKFTPQGNSLVYSTLLGLGGQYDRPNGVAVDGNGNVYIAGAITTLQFPLTLNAFQTSCLFGPNPAGGSYCQSPQAIVMKMNSTGTALSYSTLLGDGTANAIVADAAGNAYIAGMTTSNYFPLLNPVVSEQQPVSAFGAGGPGGGAFLTQLDVSGSPKFSSLLFGMQRSEDAVSMALGTVGEVLVAGSGVSPDFPVVTPFSIQGPSFVARVSLNSNAPTLSVSGPQPWAHVRNVSTTSLDISSISVAPSNIFSLSGTCGTSITLAPASECIAVIEQTTGNMPLSAQLTITSNASGSHQIFTIPPAQTLPPEPWLYTPAVIRFAPQFVGTTSSPQSITITNLASQAITVQGIQASSADFKIIGGCTGATIAPNASCSFRVGYSPSGNNSVGQITLSYSAPFITGTGNPPTVQDLVWIFAEPSTSTVFPSATNLTFGGQYPGVAGMPRIVTLFNPTPAPVTVGTPSLTGPYSMSSTCGNALAAGVSCRIAVLFTPTGNGFVSGNLQIPFSGAGSPANVTLSGIGRIFSDLQISPLSIDFGPATIGGPGNGSQLTLLNVSSSAMTISGFTLSDPEFSQTNNCPSKPSLFSAGASCIVSLLFKPNAIKAVSASLSIQHTGAGNPQVLSLTGSGRTALDLQPSLLDFGVQAVGTISQQWASIGNGTGAPPITIQSIAVSGSDFQLPPNSCPTNGQQLGSFAGCGFWVTFTPSATGTRTGSLTVIASDSSAPHVVPLIGIGGSASGASLSSSSLYFGFQAVGGSSAAQTVTLSSNGNAPLNISAITVPSGYSVTNTCRSPLIPGGNCSISVTFVPTASGLQSGTLSIVDDATNSPQTVSLSGNATDFAPQPTGGVSTASVSAGQTATYNLQVAPTGGFTGVVSIACTGAPAKSSCSVAPSSVIVSGASAGFTVNVTTTAPSSRSIALLSSGMVLFVMLLPWRMEIQVRPRNALRTSLGSLALGCMLLICSCGGGGSSVGDGGGPTPPAVSGTPPGNYALSVTATSGTQKRTLSLSLTVK